MLLLHGSLTICLYSRKCHLQHAAYEMHTYSSILFFFAREEYTLELVSDNNVSAKTRLAAYSNCSHLFPISPGVFPITLSLGLIQFERLSPTSPSVKFILPHHRRVASLICPTIKISYSALDLFLPFLSLLFSLILLP